MFVLTVRPERQKAATLGAIGRSIPELVLERDLHWTPMPLSEVRTRYVREAS